MTLTGRQIREARELVGWSRADLSRQTSVPSVTLEVVEEHESTFMLFNDQMLAIRRALEAAGIIFIETNGEGPGVRLRKAELKI